MKESAVYARKSSATSLLPGDVVRIPEPHESFDVAVSSQAGRHTSPHIRVWHGAPGCSSGPAIPHRLIHGSMIAGVLVPAILESAQATSPLCLIPVEALLMTTFSSSRVLRGGGVRLTGKLRPESRQTPRIQRSPAGPPRKTPHQGVVYEKRNVDQRPAVRGKPDRNH